MGPASEAAKKGDQQMEINLDPGWDKTIINLRGPCKLDIARNGYIITAVEIPSGEVYKLVVKRSDREPEYLLAGTTNVTSKR